MGVYCVVFVLHTLFNSMRFPGGVAGATIFKVFISLSLSLFISLLFFFFALIEVTRACARVTPITLFGLSFTLISSPLLLPIILSLGGEEGYPRRQRRFASWPIQGEEQGIIVRVWRV